MSYSFRIKLLYSENCNFGDINILNNQDYSYYFKYNNIVVNSSLNKIMYQYSTMIVIEIA